MSKIMLYKKYLELLLKKQFVDCSDIGTSYTLVSKDYEKIFLSTMHRYNDELLNGLIENVKDSESIKVIDLACGTGYNTKYLKGKWKKAEFTLCDLSSGMIKEARKLESERIKVYQNDMLSFLKTCKDESFDVVICTWAIKYCMPKKVIKECYRVLKKGGYIACIVNKKSTLPECRKILPKVFSKNVDSINKIMMELPNPICKFSFNRWFVKQRFKVIKSSEGKHVFSFGKSDEVVRFMASTGALAGYDVMINLKDEKVIGQIKEVVYNEGIQTVTHKFVSGIYEK